MKKQFKALGSELFATGKKLQIGEDGCVKLPLEGKQEVMFIQTEEGYRLIPLVPDIKRIYIEVTTKCNFDCITCIRSSWQDCLLHMEWETFENILENLKELPNLESVHFGGFGEPMMHPRIFDMLRAVKQLGLKVEMITNGSYLQKENIQQLIDLELDILFTSLDSPEEEDYNEIRQGADFQSVYHNIKNLQAMKEEKKTRKPQLGIEFVAMKKNYDQLPKLIRMAYNLGASQIIVSNLLPYHESMKDEIVYDMDDTVRMFEKDAQFATTKAQMSNMKLRTERICKFVKDKSLCINYQGNVSPCYALMHTYNCYIYGRKKDMYAFYLGNVNEKKLQDIWMDSGYVNFRRTVNENHFPSCTDCRSVEGCSYTDSNEMDCWGNSPSCAECLWARRIIACP
ncbi:tungsten-containing aldehyde ferredoxin oxidoreductase cofactor-modifying protein Cmo [Clostridium aceticum]|uniref:Tungsten-containing aldehyde ferredoxin oxidoreductase cofactor-modifying protein Cmo n=1 Tax=Clostridium aceticum TaxID=84022 RepID=A0A0D8I8X7_9CLOT|nr:tungsten cofactor oxidoreductase radical SAM maturase [Clostridium aceticum]AKL95725.1 tungsten-containing aldehyde ferredoxin oxidoreductase cofactor-modifying protein Cmo [Clostridium aceticum]KJF26723.1 radical SAM protein [Clostridium aceticum]